MSFFFIFVSVGFDSLVLPLSALDKTLPMLGIDKRVLNDEIIGTGFCSICGGRPTESAISERKTEVKYNCLRRFEPCETCTKEVRRY